MQDDPPARLVLTDEPYNVKISRHVMAAAIVNSPWPRAR